MRGGSSLLSQISQIVSCHGRCLRRRPSAVAFFIQQQERHYSVRLKRPNPTYWSTISCRQNLVLHASNENVNHLLNGILSRAERTLSYKRSIEELQNIKDDDDDDSNKNNTHQSSTRDSVMDTAETLLQKIQGNINSNGNTGSYQQRQEKSSTGTAPLPPAGSPLASSGGDVTPLQYATNPTISLTALAHLLWSHVLRPTDTAIDATSGNGGDSVALAKMLFLSNENNNNHTTTTHSTQSRLYSIDIQESACTSTYKQLQSILPQNVLDQQVKVLCRSHAPLFPFDNSDDDDLGTNNDNIQVAVVAYNLGYLPRLSDAVIKDTYRTSAGTTLESIADATLLLRVGGLVSVMTYPRTNPVEDAVVRTFLTGLGLFSSTTVDWQTWIRTVKITVDERCDDKDRNDDNPLHWNERIEEALLRVHAGMTVRHRSRNGSPNTTNYTPTWRVQEHRKLGLDVPPLLLTATRIK